jgi:D-alanyl-D-alanine carboxypeptidase/D-alanyl-D-alanine-endopeptidase (penicillin-binding protein 4)
MPEFMSSLSIAGVDGTLRKRFRKTRLKGQAHMKTGTIRGTTGIAGYVLDRWGDRWIVVSLMNNPRLQTWRGKGVENALVNWVYEGAGDRRKKRGVTSPRAAELPEQRRLQANATAMDWFLKPDSATR